MLILNYNQPRGVSFILSNHFFLNYFVDDILLLLSICSSWVSQLHHSASFLLSRCLETIKFMKCFSSSLDQQLDVNSKGVLTVFTFYAAGQCEEYIGLLICVK